MAINKETQRSITVILDKDTYDKYKELCKKEKRSVSNKTAILIEELVKKSE